MSDHYGGTWALHRRDDGKILADLVETGGDFPWRNARVALKGGLAEVRPLLVEELRVLNGVDEDVESWERTCEAVRNAVTLRRPEGQEVREFLLHIDGDQAW
ncbi:hypothetical protein OG470_20690 [Micromonospora sp. NBC_00389]|uniref:hypothetical protein n=1 Tax=Micromonospora sp. NBC_00389 TaxID=2903586 RepID=UPI002E229D76